MKAGELKQRVIVEIPQPAPDDYGQPIITWMTWATVWAAVEPLSGKRYFEAQQANADVDGVARIRHRTGLLPTMRLNYGGRILQIKSIVQPKENRRELHIYYKEALD